MHEIAFSRIKLTKIESTYQSLGQCVTHFIEIRQNIASHQNQSISNYYARQ